MKYIIGFIVGVLLTSLFFTYRIKKMMTENSSQTITAPTATVDEIEEGLPADFEAFYLKFHQDSMYQIEHVIFPLRGIPGNADSTMLVSGNYYWEKNDWRMHQPIDPKGGKFIRDFLPLGKDLITEEIYTPDGFGMQRRFMKTEGNWFLIYYAGMNRMAQADEG